MKETKLCLHPRARLALPSGSDLQENSDKLPAIIGGDMNKNAISKKEKEKEKMMMMNNLYHTRKKEVGDDGAD